MKTLLIVDTDPISSILEETLQRYGFRGIIARNAGDALDILRREPSICLVVTEMQFPDMDGLHFLIAVRAIAPGLPFIVVTSSSSIESYLLAMNFGVFEYLNKPLLPKELIRIACIALAAPQPASLMYDALNRRANTEPALRNQRNATNVPGR